MAYYNKASNFVFGAISVSIFIYIFYNADLWGESILNLYYLLVSVYGIIYWKRTSNETLEISKANSSNYAYAALIFLTCFGALYFLFFIRNTPIEWINFADMFVTAMAFAGTFLLLKRKVETWILLNLSNMVAIPVQISKDLYLTALLTLILFIVAVFGYFRWRKLLQRVIHST